MKKSTLFVAAMAMSIAAWAEKPLMTINGKGVSAEEFMYIYEKNNQAGAVDPKSMDEYLDMFINFKLKVAEAEAQGIDTTESFKKELKGYRAQATPKYLQDEAAMDSLVEMSWRHMSKDRRAAHIAIQCLPTATEQEQDSVLALINEARERVTLGKEVIKGKGKKAKKIRQPVEAGAVDQAFPFLRRGRSLPGNASVVAETDVRSLSSVAFRPGADHRLAVLHQDGRRVAVVVVRRPGCDDDMMVRPSGKVRPRQVGPRSLRESQAWQCEGDQDG